MSLTFPLAFPITTVPLAPGFVFDYDRLQNITRSRGGAVQSEEKGRTLWSISAKTAILTVDQFDEINAFFGALRGALNTFTFYDPLKARPKTYPGTGWAGFTRASGGAFNGSGTLVSASGYMLTFNTMPAGYVVRKGDMFSWTWGATRALHRSVEDAVANSAGQVTVQVEPDILPGSLVGTPVWVENAAAVFRLQQPFPQPARSNFGSDGIEFKALQVLANG